MADKQALLGRFHEFCSRGYVEAFVELLEDNEQVSEYLLDAPGNLGNTALHWASSAGHDEIVEMLIERQVQPNVYNDISDTALHLAASKNHFNTVCLLINYGCDASLVNQDGKTPAELTRDEELKVILNGAAGITGNRIRYADSDEDDDSDDE